jgi:hypothetical protein
MSNVRVKVPYEHDSSNLETIYIGITDKARPTAWKPAYRDIDRTGKRPQRVVIAEFVPAGRTVKVWVRDSKGDRPSHTQVV